jgi:hypothetical protein
MAPHRIDAATQQDAALYGISGVCQIESVNGKTRLVRCICDIRVFDRGSAIRFARKGKPGKTILTNLFNGLMPLGGQLPGLFSRLL